MIKSKIHLNWYLWFLFLIFLFVFGFIMYIIKPIISLIEGEDNFSYITFTLLFFFFELFLIVVIKDFKYLVIDRKKNNLKYYSILGPLGKTLDLDSFDNKIITSEISIRGQYDVIHLIKNGYTVFKINGLFYDNFKEINSSIPLKRVYNYKFNLKLYLKLLFTGKIKIEKE
ncbi:hypothetical protein VUJ46_02530 [Chryseobacterium sp. MYb264]|uniref:hypothetical protein n=1 Tax=Chryseobacterium sp. MYb264 TaxID=2745153 RepID=UPI002E114AFC|nr:hypothetical protein VUJ46_02530 [Chryseobacterium sp. MYb264]